MLIYCFLFFITKSTTHLSFFFSSRRRHTRAKRDWSSDVCSSDLHRRRKPLPTLALEHAVERRRTVCRQPCLPWLASGFPGQRLVEALRLVAPKVVEGQVPRDGEQPSLKAAPFVELT